MNDEQLYSIALTFLPRLSVGTLHELYQRMGSATAVVENRKSIKDIIPDISPRLADTLQDIDEALRHAEQELSWATRNKVEVLPMNSERYPQRMVDCPDAPIVVYYKGSADLNHKHKVSVVGTRHCTNYGRDLVRNLMKELRTYADILVVSGLAYGIDIAAHREALEQGFPTVAVLAHGLDQIYPSVHRPTAVKMLAQGGLITEYVSHTRMNKVNFVQRNRIVAGMTDCTIVVESAKKGGALITAGIANDYGREAFAFPGAVGAEYSQGCNQLIRENKAALITCAEDVVNAMHWDDELRLTKARREGIERQMFLDLTEEEALIVKLLIEGGDLQVNHLTVKSGIPIYKVHDIMFSLELKGVVKALAGGSFHLLEHFSYGLSDTI